MNPMPSGNRTPGDGDGGGSLTAAGREPGRAATGDDRNGAMVPMPSGDVGGQIAGEGAEAAGGVDGAGAERAVGAGTAAMDEPSRAAARETRGRAGAGAEAAMHPAAAVGHGRLAAAAAGPGLCA